MFEFVLFFTALAVALVAGASLMLWWLSRVGMLSSLMDFTGFGDGDAWFEPKI